MTRRRKTLLVAIILLLAAGGFAWHWQVTAVDRQVNALLAELRTQKPAGLEHWLIKLGLREDRRTDRRGVSVRADLTAIGPAAVPELIRALQSEDFGVRRCAAAVLGEFGDARAFDPLILALRGKGKCARCDKSKSPKLLSRASTAHPPDPLLAAAMALWDEPATVRGAAALSLARLGDPRAVAPLEELLDDEDPHVREAAKDALGRLRRQQQLRTQSEAKP